jgi:hypothetical protein
MLKKRRKKRKKEIEREDEKGILKWQRNRPRMNPANQIRPSPFFIFVRPAPLFPSSFLFLLSLFSFT